MKKRILAIEDHEENRRILGYLLASAGFEMIEAVTGEDGVAAAEKERPDLIVMDIQLPEISGLEITDRLKKDPALKAIPVVAVTAFAMRGDEQKILAAGCDAYLSKPISVTTFLETIRRFIG